VSALVVDTSSWIAWLAGGGSPLVEEALEEGRLHLPVIVAAELRSGRLAESERNELQDMLSDLPAVGTEASHWFRVGKLRADLGAKGLSVSTPDAHVAQCAIDTAGVLLSEDRVSRVVDHVVSRPGACASARPRSSLPVSRRAAGHTRRAPDAPAGVTAVAQR
jgi:predicted nucleic acid-binding protein